MPMFLRDLSCRESVIKTPWFKKNGYPKITVWGSRINGLVFVNVTRPPLFTPKEKKP
jgi:hypothetical protein